MSGSATDLAAAVALAGVAACAVCTYQEQKAAAKEKKRQRKKKRRAVSGATKKQSRALEKAVKEARAGRGKLSAKVMEGLWEQYDTDQSGDLDRKEMEPLVKEIVQIMRFDSEDLKEKLISEMERDIRAKSDSVASAIMISAMLEPIKQQIAECAARARPAAVPLSHPPQGLALLTVAVR